MNTSTALTCFTLVNSTRPDGVYGNNALVNEASLTLYFMLAVLRYPVTPVRQSEIRSEETFIDAKRAF